MRKFVDINDFHHDLGLKELECPRRRETNTILKLSIFSKKLPSIDLLLSSKMAFGFGGGAPKGNIGGSGNAGTKARETKAKGVEKKVEKKPQKEIRPKVLEAIAKKTAKKEQQRARSQELNESGRREEAKSQGKKKGNTFGRGSAAQAFMQANDEA
ncbi:hypothetical protein KC316_g5280 [Hortaea werneckii]|nr:hypothetical protein KC316_g5280 [Hortaea werneckii]